MKKDKLLAGVYLILVLNNYSVDSAYPNTNYETNINVTININTD